MFAFCLGAGILFVILFLGSFISAISLKDLKFLLGFFGIAESILLMLSLVMQLSFHNDMKKQKEKFLSYVTDKDHRLNNPYSLKSTFLNKS